MIGEKWAHSWLVSGGSGTVFRAQNQCIEHRNDASGVWILQLCHPLGAWCPLGLSFSHENLGRWHLFSPCLVLELSWHQCSTTRVHFRLLIHNFHNQWDWPNYWGNVLGWFACDSCSGRDTEINNYRKTKFRFYWLIFKCPTTTYDAMEFLAFGGFPSFSILEVKGVSHSVEKSHFLIMMSLLDAYFG